MLASRVRDFLQGFMQSKKWTEEQTADYFGLTQPNLNRILKGKHGVTLKTLEKMSDASKIPVKDFLQEEEKKVIQEEKSIYDENKFEKWCLEFREKWNHPSFCLKDAARNIMQLTFKPDTFTEIMQWLEKKDNGGVRNKTSAGS